MKNLAKALVAFQAEVTHPPMNAKNPFYKSKYTDLKTAIDHYKPFLAKHGLAIFNMLGTETITPETTMTTYIIHESGEYLQKKFAISLSSVF